MTIYLNSFRPLTRYSEGRQAVNMHNLPPFIDYSCRKEPDFLSKYPSISALCRVGKFAPRLHEGDIVVYITCKGNYLNVKYPHWRLVAILEVVKRFENHTSAALWYTTHETRLPSNCMITDNPPIPIEFTAPITEFGVDIRRWDLAYQKRARQCSIFLACQSQFIELYNPPIITNDMMYDVFARIPGTQNPPAISLQELTKLKSHCGI